MSGIINSGFPTAAGDKDNYIDLYYNSLITNFENLSHFPDDCNDNTMWTIDNVFNSNNNYPINNYYYWKAPRSSADGSACSFGAVPFFKIDNPHQKIFLWNDGEDFSSTYTLYIGAKDSTNKYQYPMLGEYYPDSNNTSYAVVSFRGFSSYNRYPSWDMTYACLTPNNAHLTIVDNNIISTSWARYINTPDSTIKFNSVMSYAIPYTGQQPAAIETNIPMFCKGQESALQDYIINGTIPSYISTKTDFKLWIKGLDSPSYKLNWHNTILEEDNYNFDNTIVNISVGRLVSDGIIYHSAFEVPYIDGSIRFTYYDLIESLGHSDSIFQPWIYLKTEVLYSGSDISGSPTCQLRRKSTSFDGMYQRVQFGADGSTLTIVNYDDDPESYDDDSDDYHDPDDNSDDTPDPSIDINVSNDLAKSYVIEPIELHKLSQFLWGTDFFDNIKLVNNSPIENIVSLKAIIGGVTGGDSETLTLGNVETTSTVKACSEVTTIDVGSITLPRKYNNFLDFEPYTKVQIYLPFYGTTMLDSSLVIDRTINIKYIIDVITGTAKIKVIHDSKTLYEYKCNVGCDLPITSNNRASVEMGYISSGLGMAASVASGNMIGATMSLLNMAQSQFQSQTIGNCNGVLNFHDSREVTIIVDRPVYTELRNFNATHGRMCNLSLTLGNLSGFTKCAENVRLNFKLLKQEEELLREILSSGFII